jgi:hypothetical protein
MGQEAIEECGPDNQQPLQDFRVTHGSVPAEDGVGGGSAYFRV